MWGTWLLGLQVPFLNGRGLHWAANENPLAFAIALSSLNLTRSWGLRSDAVNRVAALILPVYLIHENLLVRTYLGIAAWAWVYDSFGYENLLLWVALYAAVLFGTSLLLAAAYQRTLGRLVERVVDLILPRLAAANVRLGEVLDRLG